MEMQYFTQMRHIKKNKCKWVGCFNKHEFFCNKYYGRTKGFLERFKVNQASNKLYQ